MFRPKPEIGLSPDLRKSELYDQLLSSLEHSSGQLKAGTIIEAIKDPGLFQPCFKDMGSWRAWLAFLKALYGLDMIPQEIELFRQCTGRKLPPSKPSNESWVICGRRSGKSFISGLIAVYLACFRDYRHYLSPGERVHILCLAADRQQAQVVFRYVRGFLSMTPALSRLIESEKAESIDLSNGVSITVMTSSYRTIRGYTVGAVICDEISFWRNDVSANPAEEVIRAIRPAMASVPGNLLLCISSPYARTGPLYQAYQDHYGKNGDVLIWQAPTTLMNPNIDQELIRRDLENDPEAAQAEWLAQFRSDLETFLSPEAIESVTIPGRQELPYSRVENYCAFVDPSGGRGDAAALAVAHQDGEKMILDLAKRWPAPHNPQTVVEEMARLVKAYQLNAIRGDRYAGEWPRQEFLKYGIVYEPSDKDKSVTYLELLPLILSGRVELLDNPRLIQELRLLERQTRSLGRDKVDHPPGGHDDLANAVAGALVMGHKVGGLFFAGCDLS
jgi:hypothetical protein